MVSSSVQAIFTTLLILTFLSFDVDAQGTEAILTINSFEKHGDGGGPSECDGHYHSNSELIVALSTRWYNGGSRYHSFITITASNGQSVTAQVVDECDSHRGFKNNIVDASKGVWTALGVPKSNWGWMKVTWSDA